MALCPAPAGRTRFDMADIVRRNRCALEAREDLAVSERRVLDAIEQCRTAALGGHVDVCRSCGYEHPAYNSCRNRHCPKCQALAQERWIAARGERILPERHFHVVFTLPGELRTLAKYRPRALFDALFAAASETLLELGRSRLGGRIGATMVLHTWTRDLRFHPHVHAIVTAGALALDGARWQRSNRKYLFPVAVMGLLLRGKMIAALRQMRRDGAFATFDELRDLQAFEQFIAKLAAKKWLVYAKKPFRQSRHVLAYLGRYTHRVAISNSRLVDVTDERVVFRTKDGKTVALAPVEFLRRFLDHVLPDGLHKIRHYGLYASRHATEGATLDRARALLGGSPVRAAANDNAVSWHELLFRLTGRDVDRCPRCGDLVDHLPLPSSTARAPPTRSAS